MVFVVVGIYLICMGVMAITIWAIGQVKFELDADDDDLIFGSFLASIFWPFVLPLAIGAGAAYLFYLKLLKILKN